MYHILVNPLAKSVYQVCGSTLPHTLVSTSSGTVNKGEMTTISAVLSAEQKQVVHAQWECHSEIL